MLNYYLYKLFNPEIKHYNNMQLLLHWKNNNNNKIYSLESFFLKYPYFNHDLYKLYNSDINIRDKFELMAHWHLIGIYENRICSDEHFNILYPNFNILFDNLDNIYKYKNEYHINYKKSIESSEEELPIKFLIEEYQNEDSIEILEELPIEEPLKELLKELPLEEPLKEPLEELPIEELLKELPIEEPLKELPIEEPIEKLPIDFLIKETLPVDNDYLLINPNNNNLLIYVLSLENINFIFKSLSLINFHNINILLYSPNKILIDNIHFLNFILLKDINNEELFSSLKYIISDDISIIKSLNKYINITKIFIPELFINNLELIDKIILVDNIFDNNYFKKNILITEYDKYLIKDNNIIKFNKDIDNYLNKIYINQYFLNNYTYICNIDYNIVYIADEKINLNKINIIFIVDKDNINYCEYNLQKILKKNYININILVFIKDNIFINNSNNFNKFIVKNVDTKNITNIILYLNELLDHNSLIVLFDNKYLIDDRFSLESIYSFFILNELLINDYFNFIIFKKELLNYCKDENTFNLLRNNDISFIKESHTIDSLIEIYKKNRINYKYFEINNLKNIKIKNNIHKYQLIIFLSNKYDINFIIKKIKNLNNINAQINIIHFNDKQFDLDKYDVNYIFIDTLINKFLAYNIVFNLFEKYLFQYNFLLFYNVQTDIETELLNNYIYSTKTIFFTKIFDIMIIDKNFFEKIGEFDPEIFDDDTLYQFFYFLEKYKKINKIENEYVFEFTYNKLYDSFYNIIKSDTNNSLLNFFNKKNLIDYNLFKKIKIVIINLEERKDRLIHIKKECKKLDIENFEIFNAIKIDDDNLYIKYSKLFDKNKLWKKNNIDYFKSALGCKASHLEILKKYSKIDDNDYLMIIEDDAIFENNTLIYLNLALFSLKNSDWDILFLSSNLKDKKDAILIAPNLLKIKNGLTTTAQIINKKNISTIIDIIENSSVEIDNTYNKFIKNKYSVYPMCVYQEKFYSDINKSISNYGKYHKKFNYF